MNRSKQKYHYFEVARRLVREEGLGSLNDFKKWHKHNFPKMIPKYPESIYKKSGWISWNDFLGNKGTFAQQRKVYRPFESAKQFARSLKLKNKTAWIAYAKGENTALPADIPKRPDLHYKEWYTWKDFLGSDTSIKTVLNEIKKIKILLFIIRMPNRPSNVLKVNTTYGGQDAIMELVNEGAKIITIYEFNDRFDWHVLLDRYGKSYWNGDADEYTFTNAAQFISDLSRELNVYKWIKPEQK